MNFKLLLKIECSFIENFETALFYFIKSYKFIIFNLTIYYNFLYFVKKIFTLIIKEYIILL